MSTFTFTSPTGGTINFRDGRTRTTGLTRAQSLDLREATLLAHPVRELGPDAGGHGNRDPASVYLAVGAEFPTWIFSGEKPPLPEGDSDEPTVVL